MFYPRFSSVRPADPCPADPYVPLASPSDSCAYAASVDTRSAMAPKSANPQTQRLRREKPGDPAPYTPQNSVTENRYPCVCGKKSGLLISRKVANDAKTSTFGQLSVVCSRIVDVTRNVATTVKCLATLCTRLCSARLWPSRSPAAPKRLA